MSTPAHPVYFCAIRAFFMGLAKTLCTSIKNN
jgi:hypothetical protein